MSRKKYIEKVILSCKTLDQLNHAFVWYNNIKTLTFKEAADLSELSVYRAILLSGGNNASGK